jgi:hypothetical protein
MTRYKIMYYVLVVAVTLLASGCGGGSTSSTLSPSYVQAGKVVGGPVSGATVFADHWDPAIGRQFVLDAGEIVAQFNTDDSGSYRLPVLPTYDYVLVSRGGIDTVTGLDAIQMLAPAGAANITPFTTLVALDATNVKVDPTIGVRKKLEALLPNGARYDTDVSQYSSPAALLLLKSIETATRSLTDAITSQAIIQQSGYTISQFEVQNAYIQVRIMQAIAQRLAGPTLDITIPDNLAAELTTALTVAIVAIRNDNSNNLVVGDAATIAGKVASDSVTAAVAALETTSATGLSTAIVKLEAGITGLKNVATAFMAAVTSTVNAIIGTTITRVLAPPTFSPPSIPVVRIPISMVLTGSGGGPSSGGTNF